MIDIIIVFVFIIYSVSSGFIAQTRASRNLEEYFLAGRTIKGWRAGFSMAATQFAADTPLLVAGLIASGGIFMLWRLWIYGLGFLMIGFLLGGSWRRAKIITDAELTEIRYSGKGVLVLRGLKAIYYGTVMNCTILAMVLVAATRISEIFLQWHLWLPEGFYNSLYNIVKSIGISLSSGTVGIDPFIATTNNIISITIIIAFTTLYSTTGGLRSVIATDTVQFSLAMLGTFLYSIIAISKSGGLSQMLKSLIDIYGANFTNQFLSFVPTARDAVIPFLVIVSLQWFFERNSDGTGYIAQRLMSCKTDRDAKFATFIFTWLQIFLRSLLWLIIGIALLVIYPFDPSADIDQSFIARREILFATGIRDILPPGVRGIMLTGLLAALASTIDTHLTWGASYWSNDIYSRIINKGWLKREPSNRELVIVARLSNILILTIALIIMANLGSIQQAWYITLLFGAGTGGVLVLRWLWERINLLSEITAITVSLICAPIILFTVHEEWLRLLLMASISTIAVIVVTLKTKPTDDDVIDEFYRKVKPPGFWKNTAEKIGITPQVPIKSFKEGVYLTITTSLTVYLMLIGFAKLILPKPGDSIIYPITFIIAGFLTIPLWWRKLTEKQHL